MSVGYRQSRLRRLQSDDRSGRRSTNLGWKLRRLRAMALSEVLHRSLVAVRDRTIPPRYSSETAEQTYLRLFGGTAPEIRPTSASCPDVEARAEVATAAHSLAEHRWKLFGAEVCLDDPPAWSRNYRTGEFWPELATRKLDFRRTDVAGDVKFTWELGRLTMLPTLATAARWADDPRLVDQCERWLSNWIDRNPFANGIHYTSGIEMAVRVMTMHWTLAQIGSRLACGTLVSTLGQMAQQALHCRDHLSLGSSANNHLIAEYGAMTLMGASYPSMRGSRELLTRGLSGLESEVLRQIHPDGVPAEQAFGYLPFVWEMLLIALTAAEASGQTISQETRQRLAASLAFARQLRLESGRLPSIGDDDDGRILLADVDASRLDLVGNALAAWLGTDDSAALLTGAHSLAWLLVGRTATAANLPIDGRVVYPDGGYTVWRHGRQLVTFDHGPLGYGSLAAHAHADGLAITVSFGPATLITDPGTSSYHGDHEARDRCRSTPVHATVHFGHRSQSEMLGPFLWGRRATIAPRGEAYECRWWSGEKHIRRVHVSPGMVEIHDQVDGRAPYLSFPLPPGAAVEVEDRNAAVDVRLHGMRLRLRLAASGTGPWSRTPSDHAAQFGQPVKAIRLTAPIEAAVSRTVITIEQI